ncbi:hypothetical protein EYC84_006110 [Monilinia fructicola]|uniref:Aquaporin n=1 Tax=Monilinia fructicola TaxID=38448 RepID=A0A5M9KAL2_MONFR|nr:hypothetical protein EYC84_006110 [Monilinia fructicola]
MNINEPRQGGGFVLPFFNDSRKSRKPHAGRDALKSNQNPFLGRISNTQLHLTVSNIVGTPSNPAQLLYSALCFGFSLAVNAWVFFRISGGLFNPAVTMGMCLVGALPYFRGLLLIIAQILGGITAAAIVSCLFPGPVTFNTTLAGGTSIAQGLFIEMFLTAELVFTIFMLAAEKHRGTFIAPIGIGLALFIAELTGLYFTGGSVNPARSFGPSVVTHNFPGYHWIYWVGPILGAILASGFYKFIKMLEYETANPGQDATRVGESFDPEAQAIRNRVSFADEGMVGRELDESGASRVHESGNYGHGKEYGTHRRPFSDSPAPPHPNDQFAGLNQGGLHADDLVKGGEGQGTVRDKRDSEGTLVDNGKKSAMRSNSNGEGAGVLGGSARDNTHNNQRIG